MRRWKLIAAALVVFTAGCGSSNKTVITVQVFPSTVTVVLGGTQVFTASVQGSTNTSVNWSVSGSGCAATMSNPNPCGTIDNSTGLYHAPTSLPSPPTVTVTATSQAASSAAGSATVTLDSGIRVTLSPSSGVVGTSENLQITATVTGPATTTIASNGAVRSNNVVTITTTAAHNLLAGQGVTISGVTDSSFNGTFCVATVPSSTTFAYSQTGSNASSGNGTVTNGVNWSVVTTGTVGTISCTGLYTAPAAVPSPAQVTIKATAAADPTQSGRAAVTLANAADPTLSAITPTTAAAGSVFQDVYLTGINFFSTSTVLANGTALPTASTTFLSTTLLRARIPSCLPGSPPPCPANLLQNPGPITLVVQRQSGGMSSPQTLGVTATRPAIVSANPDSIPQCISAPCSPASVNLNGGFFSPSTAAVFNGQAGNTTASVMSPNQLNVGITLPAGATAAGLFQLAVQNSGAARPLAAVNLAVEPSITANPPSTIATLSVGRQPSAVAVNIATNQAVVASQGDNTISVIDLRTSSVSCPIPVGRTPTGVAVDNQLNRALVVNQGDNTVSVVDLSSVSFPCPAPPPPAPPPPPSIALPSGTTPVSIGENRLTGHALVANQSTNTATVIDVSPLPTNPPVVLGTAAISTGPNPAVAIEPRLDWAIVTPSGAGTVSVVDMSHTAIDPTTGKPTFIVVATKSGEPTLQGVAVNPETDEVLMTNPSSTGAETFSLLDQTTVGFQLEANHVAAAVNPLTNIGVTVNSQLNAASIIDLGTPIRLGSTISVGVNPVAVAIDPASNVAVVANQGDNTVSILSLGSIRSLHITQVSPVTTFTSAPTPALTVVGHGFSTGTPIVRLDGTTVSTVVNSDRQLTATVPPAMLGAPRQYAVDVQDTSTGEVSNVAALTVIQRVPSCVPTSAAPCVGTAPGAVAIGQVLVNNVPHDLAVVTNTGSNNISVIDLGNPGTCPIASIAPQCTITVGADPEGVDVVGRIGRAVVTNRGDGTASLVDLVNGIVSSTVSVGQQPIGVAINLDTLVTAVTNSVSNSLSLLAADTGRGLGTVAMDQRPVAVAIDINRNLAAVANATQNNLDLVDLAGQLIVGRPNVNFQIPNGVAFDPCFGCVPPFSDVFLIANSLINNVDIVDPGTLQVTPIRVGINPTSIAYNFQSATVVTVNSASHTASVMDFCPPSCTGSRVRAVLGVDGSPQQSVAIDPQTNLAVVADQKNNRVLLVPLPR